MEANFSEFSYGYAITEELASGKVERLLGAPMFPSLYEEGQSGGGYDVKLPLHGAPLFLQFKLSHCLQRSNALEWHLFGRPYYRMYLRPLRYSNQHNLLLTLEQRNTDVYYVAPEFHTDTELNEAYVNGCVSKRSAYFSPLDTGNLPDEEWHYVVFAPYSSTAYLCSEEPRKLESNYLGKVFWESQIQRTHQRETKINEEFFEKISYQMVGVIRERIETFDQLDLLQSEVKKKRESLKEKAQFAAYLARVYLDAELFIVAEQGNVS